MMGFRERRLGCRLYVDRQSDAEVVKKLDRMQIDGSFPNQTELIKRGIELAYAEVYGEGEKRIPSVSDVDIGIIAGAVVKALKPELEKLFTEQVVRIYQAEIPETVSGRASVVADDTVEAATITETNLPSQTFSFLKGLNDD